MATSSFSGTDVGLLAGAVVLIVLSAVFALSETAITRMSKVKAVSLVEEKRRGARLSTEGRWSTADRNIPVILFALEICTLVAATIIGVVANGVVGPLGVVLATVFEIVVIFVFAELAPKIWAVQHTERAALLDGSLPTGRCPVRAIAVGHSGANKDRQLLSCPARG